MRTLLVLMITLSAFCGCSTVQTDPSQIEGSYTLMGPPNSVTMYSILKIQSNNKFYFERVYNEGGQIHGIVAEGEWELDGRYLHFDSSNEAPYPPVLKISFRSLFREFKDGSKEKYKKSANKAVEATSAGAPVASP